MHSSPSLPCTVEWRAWVVGVQQDLPMGALTVTFAIRRYGIPDAVVLSLVTSSIMLGMKLDKLSLLKHWCAFVAWRASSMV